MSRAEPARSPAVAAPWPERRPDGRLPRATGGVPALGARETAVAARLQRGDLYGVLILLLLTGLVALDGVQQGRLLFRTDIITAYLPWYSHLGERLRDFDIPGWLPYSFSGAPFAGDPESGWMYLPAMVIFTIAPGVAGFNAFIVFHLVVAGLAAYAFARLLGMSVMGAVVAGAAFEFGGFLERTRCCTVHAQVAMWVPIAFIGVEQAVRARTWLARVGWWSLAGLACSQMLTGWLGQGAYYGLLAVGAYVLYRTLIAPPHDRRSPVSRLANAAAHGGATLAIGIGLAAGGIWPRVVVVGRSLLEGGSYGGVARQMAGWSLPTTVDRLLTLDDRGGRWYASGAVLSLAVLAPFVARRRFSTPFLAVYSVLVLGLASREFWLHSILYLLPQLASLHRHLPERALTVFYIGPALLAGATVSALARPAVGRVRLALLGLLPIGLLLLLWDVFTSHGDAPHGVTIAGVAAVSALIVLVAAVRHPAVIRLVGVGLLAAVFVDPSGWLIAFRLEHPDSASFIKAFHGPSDMVVDGYTDPIPAARALQRLAAEVGQPVRYFGYDPALLHYEGDQRTYVVQYWDRETWSLLVNNRSVLLHLEDVQGYNPVQSARYDELIDAINGAGQSYHQANILYRGIGSPLLDLLNARYVVIPAVVPPGRPDLLHLSQRYPTVYADADVRIVEDTDALPRVWIVHDARRVEPERVWKLLGTGTVDPRQEALLDLDAGLPALDPAKDPAAEAVRVTDHRPDEMALDVTMTAPGLVVLSEGYDPDWTATVDGKAVPVLAAFRALRAVPVPAGAHTVHLSYAPRSLMLGLYLSIGTALLVAAIAGLLLWRRAIGRPALVGYRVEGWLAPRPLGRGRPLGTVRDVLGAVGAALGAIPVWLRLGGLTLAAAAIRLIDLGVVAPPVGERLRASAADRPWSAALGLDGLRASAPPLFVAMSKLLRAAGVERLPDHLLTALAGAATIPVVFALGGRLLGRRVGWGAAALLAVSPVHLALSRSGEPPAVGLLAVAASYLALVTLVQTSGRGWLALYAASIVIALYADPTTAYALAPQLVVGLALARREGRRSTEPLVAGVVGLLAGLPWLFHLRDAATWFDADAGRDHYLGELWNRLFEALPLAVGLDGLGSWLRTARPGWLPASAVVLLLGVLPAGIAGVAALRGRRPASLLCRATMVAFPVLAVLASLLTEGPDPATLASALLGWTMLASAWLARGDLAVDVRRWGAVGWSVLILTSLLAIPTAYDARRGEPWRDAAPILTSQAQLGFPIFVEGGDPLADQATVSLVVGDRAAVDGDAGWLSDPSYDQIDGAELGDALSAGDDGRPVNAFWLIPDGAQHPLRGPIASLGYSLAMAIDLETLAKGIDGGRLELWARPGAAVGEPVAIDGGFRAPPNEVDTWRLTGNATIDETPSGPAALTIAGEASRATYRLPAVPGLYLLDGQIWTAGAGVGRVTVKCVSDDQNGDAVDLVKQTVSSPEGAPPGAWQDVPAAIVCPTGTTSLAIILDRRGDSPVAFRDLTLRASPTDYPTVPPLTAEEQAAQDAPTDTNDQVDG